MASRLDTIIRLRKWELDEQRRVLAALQAEEDAILARMQSLEEEVRVQMLAGDQLEVSTTSFGHYLEGARVRAEVLELARQEQAEKVADQQDNVAETFRELKTFEIARDQEMKRKSEKEAREEQAAFDELGVQNHTRAEATVDSKLAAMRR